MNLVKVFLKASVMVLREEVKVLLKAGEFLPFICAQGMSLLHVIN